MNILNLLMEVNSAKDVSENADLRDFVGFVNALPQMSQHRQAVLAG